VIVRARELTPVIAGPLRSVGLARSTDPETSREAADRMDPSGQHRVLLEAFERIGPANLSVIAPAAGLTEHQVSRRLSELEAAGYIRWTGETALGPSGRRQRVLGLTGAHLEVPA
jgi:DNA-binding MarR family transcriptional regulator